MRRLDPLSPLFAFPALWMLGASLAQIRVLEFQGDWPAMAWIVIVAVPLAFVAGGVLGREVARSVMTRSPGVAARPRPDRRSRRLLVGLVAIGWLEQIHQFAVAGVVPLLSANIDAARVSLPGGPTIVLANGLAIGAIVALTVPRRLLTRSALPEVTIAAVALSGYLAAGGRGTVLMPVVVALIARSAFWGYPPLRLVLAGGILAAASFSALFYLRVSQGAVEPFDAELFGEVVPSTPWILVPLLPIYFALAMNFEALAAVVGNFPSVTPYGHGAYDALGLDIVFSGARSLGAISAQLTPPWLTSTLAGPLWADGGLILVVTGLLVLGAVSCASHAVARRSGELRHALLFAYVLYLTLFCVYQNVWTQQVDWIVVAPSLLLVGAYVTNPDQPPRLALRLRMNQISVTARRGLSVAGLAVLAILASAVVIAVSDVGIDRVEGTRSPSGDRPVPFGTRFALPTTTLADDDDLVTDGDIPTDNEPLRVIAEAGDRLAVERFLRVGKRRIERLRNPLDLAAPAAGTVFDISHWTRDDDGVLFMIRNRGRSIDVRAIVPTSPVRTIARARVPIERVEAGTVRDFAIAHWSGSRPDLFVIQRGAAISRVRVSVYSGESSFSKRILDVRSPVRGIARPSWSVDVGRVAGARPDVILVSRGSRSRRPEIHVLDGDNRFASFLMQRKTALPKNVASKYRYAFGSSLGSPAVYAIDSTRPDRPRLTNLLLTE